MMSSEEDDSSGLHNSASLCPALSLYLSISRSVLEILWRTWPIRVRATLRGPHRIDRASLLILEKDAVVASLRKLVQAISISIWHVFYVL